MSQTHTPTPWIFAKWAMTDEQNAEAIKHGLTPVQRMGNNGERYVSDADGSPIALVMPRTAPKRGKGYGHVDPERDANAHLIAAAPDLLAACKIALRLMREHGHTHDNPIQEPTCDYLDTKDTGESAPLSEVLAAAIRKAEGGT